MKLQAAAPVFEPMSSDPRKLIEQRFRQEFPQRIHNFRIEVLDGGLVLEGRVKTYYGKQEVLHAVRMRPTCPSSPTTSLSVEPTVSLTLTSHLEGIESWPM